MNDLLVKKAGEYLNQLCVKIGDRSVGSSGNISATEYFKNKVSHFGWEIEEDELNVIDWEEGAAVMAAGNEQFAVKGSPYSAGCSVNAELAVVSNIDELERFEITGRAVLLCGDLAREQLMPKNFVFYNPEHHRKIISLLEEKNPAVIICATGRNSALAGGAYPFPLIEDGDFDIPSVFMTDVEGERLAALNNSEVTVNSTSRRIAARAYNITAKKSGIAAKRIILSAHIDAKKGTPGAIDNGTGVTVLMLLAELLKDYAGKYTIELAPFNGEDTMRYRDR